MSIGNKQYRVVIADDVEEVRESLRRVLEPNGYDAFLVPNGEFAIQIALKAQPDLIILDITMPGISGFETAQELRRHPETADVPLMFITGDTDVQTLVQAFEVGAVDYITKPFTREEVLARANAHVELYRLRKELEEEIQRRQKAEARSESAEKALSIADQKLTAMSQQVADRWTVDGFIGTSKGLTQVIRDIKKIQTSDTISVVITGESGVGKELIARAIHVGSPRASGPFVAINCATIPKDLAESLFFGHIKGAFSGAIKDQLGYFEMAQGGTLFLDELGELPLDMQSKLLRALEEKEIRQVGSSKHIGTNVRILSATNRNLMEAIKDQSFREDLYNRLARYTIHVPPLRERKEDIPLLARHFMEQFAKEMGKMAPRLSNSAIQKLMAHDFPGNIRELKNVIERTSIECAGSRIQARDVFIIGKSPSTLTDVQAKRIDYQSKETARYALGEQEEAIAQHVESRKRITNSQCRELLGLTIHRANYLLNKMSQSGFLLKTGAKRNACYIPGPLL